MLAVQSPVLNIKPIWENNPLLVDKKHLEADVAHLKKEAWKNSIIAAISLIAVAIICILGIAAACFLAIEFLPLVLAGSSLVLLANDSLIFRKTRHKAQELWQKKFFEERVLQKYKKIEHHIDLLTFEKQKARSEELKKKIKQLEQKHSSLEDEKKEITTQITKIRTQSPQEDVRALDLKIKSLNVKLAALQGKIDLYRAEIPQRKGVEQAKTPALELAFNKEKLSYLIGLHTRIGAIPLSERKIDLICELNKVSAGENTTVKAVHAYSALIPIIARALVHQKLHSRKILTEMKHFFIAKTDKEGQYQESYQFFAARAKTLEYKPNKSAEEKKELSLLKERLNNFGKERLKLRHAYYEQQVYAAYLAHIASNPFGSGDFTALGTLPSCSLETDSVEREIFKRKGAPLLTSSHPKPLATLFSREQFHKQYMKAIKGLIRAAHANTLPNQIFTPNEIREIQTIIQRVLLKRKRDLARMLKAQKSPARLSINPFAEREEYLTKGLAKYVEKLMLQKLTTSLPFLDLQTNTHMDTLIKHFFTNENASLWANAPWGRNPSIRLLMQDYMRETNEGIKQELRVKMANLMLDYHYTTA